MKNTNFNSKNESWFSSSTFKSVIISIMVLIFLIPANMVENLIVERQLQSRSASDQISDQWAKPQKIAACALTIPMEVSYTEQNLNKTRYDNLLVLPDLLDVSGDIITEIRYRGIYKFPVYMAKLKIKGKFTSPKIVSDMVTKMQPEKAYITLGLTDLRGIENNPILKMEGNEYEPLPGVKSDDLVESGITFMIPIGETNKLGTFEINLNLRGSESVMVYPLGKTTSVQFSSSWKSPSFTGTFLPKIREINEKGFTASWSILHLNRNFPQEWINKNASIAQSEVGVSLIQTVDHYQKAIRSVKYSLMFTALTFMAFFLTEIIRKTRIHPIQYGFTGIALVIFYSLLTSFSEHISFNFAFFIATFMIISLIVGYSQVTFKDTQFSLIMLLVLSVLYLFLFTLLQLEDFALLIGNIGLFAALAMIMFVSRKINWYKPIDNLRDIEESENGGDIQ